MYMQNHNDDRFIDDSGFNVVPLTITPPLRSKLVTATQIRRFELLRLAFFVLKLRRLEQNRAVAGVIEEAVDEKLAFYRNLLYHAIFQQVVTLIKLGAREQAMQLIETCRK
jgi:hypothetical protein